MGGVGGVGVLGGVTGVVLGGVVVGVLGGVGGVVFGGVGGVGGVVPGVGGTAPFTAIPANSPAATNVILIFVFTSMVYWRPPRRLKRISCR